MGGGDPEVTPAETASRTGSRPAKPSAALSVIEMSGWIASRSSPF